MAEKSGLVLLAEGTEEMEAVIAIDVLRRAKIQVTVAGLGKDVVECSRGVNIKPEVSLKEVKNILYSVVVVPGGLKGANNLLNSPDVKEVLQLNHKAGNYIAAICAGPTVLQCHDIGKGKKITSHPTFKDKLCDDYNYREDRVVTDGNIITSRGPGTAIEFALVIVDILVGSEFAKKIADGMVHLS